MAKKSVGSPGNKSQAIRDALSANPEKSPKEIAEMLTAQGYKVNAQYVSTIKSNANKKAGGASGGRVVRRGMPGRRAAATGGSPIDAALELIKAAGGLDQAMGILQTVAQIRSVI